MALEITLHYSDPTTDPANKQPFTIYPGETNTTSTSLTLVGQGTMNYGKYIMEGFLHQLENFCSPANTDLLALNRGPENATRGQLWYDTTHSSLKVLRNIDTAEIGGAKTYNWATVGNVVVSTTAPENKEALWYDISNGDATQWQLKIFNHSVGVNAWVSVAERYVKRTGDSLTGDLSFTVTEKGLVGTLSGFTNRITPTTTRGPALIGGQHATVVINNASATVSGAEFVVGTGTSISTATDSNGRLFSVTDAGVVTVHKNVLSMNSRKITNLADGTIPADGVNFGQLTSARAALQTQVDANGVSIASLNSQITGKVSKSGDSMSGALTINNTLYTGGLLSAAGGLAVSGGNATFALNTTTSGNMTVSGTSSQVGAVTMNTTLTVGGAVQLNSSLIANGATQLKSTVAITGLATLSNGLNVAGNTTIGGTTTLAGLALMNQARVSITNAKHLTTKEYVDYQFASIPQPLVPTGLWVGTTTIANIAATYSDVNAYPPGTTIVFVYSWQYSYGTGNGTATATATQVRQAVRTINNGWMESGNLN